MEKSTRKFSSTEKILDVLFLFASHQQLTAQQISTELRIPLSTTYKYIEILFNRDLLGKSPGNKSYCLGLMMYKLGKLFVENKNYLSIAIPHMKILSSRAKETIFLSVINGWEMIIIEKIEPPTPFKLSVELNTKVPLHIGAAAKVLLAYQPESFIDEYIQIRGVSKSSEIKGNDLKILKDQLLLIKKKGYGYADSEAQSWLKGIAAPIFHYDEKIIASIAIVMPHNRITDEKIEEMAEMVKKTASDISNDLRFQNTA